MASPGGTTPRRRTRDLDQPDLEPGQARSRSRLSVPVAPQCVSGSGEHQRSASLPYCVECQRAMAFHELTVR